MYTSRLEHCLLKSISSTRCLQASQLIWSTKPWNSSGKGWRPLLDICWRTEEEERSHLPVVLKTCAPSTGHHRHRCQNLTRSWLVKAGHYRQQADQLAVGADDGPMYTAEIVFRVFSCSHFDRIQSTTVAVQWVTLHYRWSVAQGRHEP